MLGSLGGVTWSTQIPTLPFLVLPLIALPWLARALNALLLGHKDAQYLGFDPAAITRAAVILAALSVGASRSEEHTSELQSLMRISYAVFCLKKKKQKSHNPRNIPQKNLDAST